MVIDWFRFLLRQLATALTVVTAVLLISEILMPASILPYFNLHILVLVTFFIAITSPMIEEKSRLRIVFLIPIAVVLLAYAWVVFGTSTSGLALFGGLGIVVVGVIVALTTSPSIPLLRKEREVMVSEETIVITADGIEVDETSVFMR